MKTKTSTIKEKYKKAIETLREIAKERDPDVHSIEYWDSGNYDDTYELGVRLGQDIAAEKAEDTLKELKES